MSSLLWQNQEKVREKQSLSRQCEMQIVYIVNPNDNREF
jgi:hypothetical protein